MSFVRESGGDRTLYSAAQEVGRTHMNNTAWVGVRDNSTTQREG